MACKNNWGALGRAATSLPANSRPFQSCSQAAHVAAHVAAMRIPLVVTTQLIPQPHQIICLATRGTVTVSNLAQASNTYDGDDEAEGEDEPGGDLPTNARHQDALAQPSLPVQQSATPGLFRYWHEDKGFKGTWFLAEQRLLARGGQRVGGSPKASPTVGKLGWQAMHEWDMLWSTSTLASKAAEAGLRPGQLSSAVPGSRCITRKKMLARTLRKAYGDEAFASLTPTTFELPSQLGAWLEFMRRKPSNRLPGMPEQWWILKTAQNLGKGMVICPQKEAIKEVVARQQAVLKASPAEKKKLKPFVVAQEYIRDPLLINGCKFGIRVWAVVTSTAPLIVHMHTNGLVLFSSKSYHDADIQDIHAHLTNYAQNVDGQVWSLQQLRQHLGDDVYADIHQQIRQIAAKVFTAGASHMHAECGRLFVPLNTVFEVFGLDFLVDAALHPWLLEVNATPSLAVEHAQPEVEQLISDQKQGMLDDLLGLLDVPGRFVKKSDEQGLTSMAAAAMDTDKPWVIISDSSAAEEHRGWWLLKSDT